MSDSDSEQNQLEADLELGLLGSLAQPKMPAPFGYLEVTLNYPRTASFLKMCSVKQKILYSKIWHHVRSFQVQPGMVFVDDDYEFEYCKSGQIHLHGYLPIYKKEYFIEGILSDVAKLYLEGLPKKYNKFNDVHMFPDLHRYRCPSICLQHDNMSIPTEVERFERWKSYMTKVKSNN